MIKKLYYSALVWMAIGLIGGVYYRTITKAQDFDTTDSFTQLGVVHTHSLVLGVVFVLIALILEKIYYLSAHSAKAMKAFFYFWNAGVFVSVWMMAYKGTLQVLGKDWSEHPAIAGVSGLGHIMLTIGFIALFSALGTALKKDHAN